MPFGYKKYLLKQGKSERTILDYISVIEQFFAHLDRRPDHEKLEVFEIQTRHIKDFLDDKYKQGNIERTTLNKNISILKSFFNHLWESKQIPIDPTTKIKHSKYKIEKKILLNYRMLLEILPSVLANRSYSDLKKAVYTLAIKGFRIQDFHILKKDVIHKKRSVLIFPKTHEPVELFGQEYEVFITVYNQSLFNESEYIFVTKRRDNGELVPIEIMGIHKHLMDIQRDYRLPQKLNTNLIRHVYAHYLYHEMNNTIERVAEIYGIENTSAALLIKESGRRTEIS